MVTNYIKKGGPVASGRREGSKASSKALVRRDQERTCLYCGMPFQSWGSANRRCIPCTETINQWIEEEVPDVEWMNGSGKNIDFLEVGRVPLFKTLGARMQDWELMEVEE